LGEKKKGGTLGRISGAGKGHQPPRLCIGLSGKRTVENGEASQRDGEKKTEYAPSMPDMGEPKGWRKKS